MFEPETEFVVNFAHDFIACFGEVGEGFGRFINEDEGGFVTNPYAVQELTFEASLLDEPGGVDLVAVGATTYRNTFVFGDFGLSVGKVNVFEERARAGFAEGVGELVGANGAYGVANGLGAKVGDVVHGEVVFDRGVEWAGHLTFGE